MASFTLNRGDLFPTGTLVAAYAYSAGIFSGAGAPPGTPVTTATAAADGTVTFTGLGDGVSYIAYAVVSSQPRYVRFATPGGSTPSGGSGVPVAVVDTKGDLIVGTGSDAVSRLAPGSDGQILTADSTPSQGVRWSSAPAGGIPSTVIDAKGDVVVGSASDAATRLAPGSDGQVLTVDAAQAVGLKWAAAPSPTFVAPFSAPGTLAVTTGTAKFRVPMYSSVVSIAATVGTAPTGTPLIVDVRRNGATMFPGGTGRPTIAAGSTVSSIAVPPTPTLAAGDLLSVDVAQVGSTGAGADLTVTVELIKETTFAISGLVLPGTSGNYVSTPSSAALGLATDLDIRVKATLPDWTPGTAGALAAKWQATATDGWLFQLDATGKLQLAWNESLGSFQTVLTTNPVGIADGLTRWVRVTRVGSTGAVVFYTSIDGSSWTTVETLSSPPESIRYAAGVPVTIGANSAGTANLLAGTIHQVVLRGSVGGTIVGDFNPTVVLRTASFTPTQVTDAYGNTWTVNGSGWTWAS